MINEVIIVSTLCNILISSISEHTRWVSMLSDRKFSVVSISKVISWDKFWMKGMKPALYYTELCCSSYTTLSLLWASRADRRVWSVRQKMMCLISEWRSSLLPARCDSAKNISSLHTAKECVWNEAPAMALYWPNLHNHSL